MSDSPRSIESFLAQIDKEVAALPPGSDLAGFITKRHRELGEMLARRVAQKREAACEQADFPPSPMSPVRPADGDEAGSAHPPKDHPSSRG